MNTSTLTNDSHNLVIDFMYIDLTSCDRCLGTETNLQSAIELAKGVLDATGVVVDIRKTLVESVEQARDLRFESSPTIRINGQDIALDTIESNCGSCSDICGDDTDCRVWVWKGNEYTDAPIGMIVDAILQVVYGGSEAGEVATTYDDVPENLKRFFLRKASADDSKASSCCPEPEESDGCGSGKPVSNGGC